MSSLTLLACSILGAHLAGIGGALVWTWSKTIKCSSVDGKFNKLKR